MKYTIIALLLTLSSSTLLSRDITSTTQDIRAFVLPKGALTVRGALHTINETVDVLNINTSPATNKPYSALGNTHGGDLSLAYGIDHHFSLYYNYSRMNISYANSTLKNGHHEIYTRINFYDNPQNVFDDFSLDVGYVRDASKDFNTELQDLDNNSYYLRFLWGNRFNSALLNFYTALRYNKIHTTVAGNSADSTEKALSLGVTNTIEFSHFLLDSSYEYLRMFDRPGNLDAYKSNHTLKSNLGYILNKNALIYVGVTFMSSQFNGHIPYLYNQKTQNSFDNAYTYLSCGFVYNFSLKK